MAKIKWVKPTVPDVAHITLTRDELETLVEAAREGARCLSNRSADKVLDILDEVGYPS